MRNKLRIDHREKLRIDHREKKLKGSGEKHAYLYTGSDNSNMLGLEKASYMGPDTLLFDRIISGSKPKTYSDTVSQAHDLRYSLAGNTADIRKADNKMLENLKKASNEKLDYQFNIKQGEIGIKSKIFLEDYLGVKPETFASFGKDKLSDVELLVYTNKLKELELEGFGKKKKLRRLKMCKF